MLPLVLLLIAAGASSGQLNNVGMPGMPQVTRLDVQCAKSGMTVDIEFDLPFNGIIFSKGHFSDPACRYVEANSNGASYKFVIPMQGCGTETAQSSASTGNGLSAGARTIFSNVVVIQNDGLVQEIWDSARKLTCAWVDRVTKTLSVRPVSVNMLEAVEARFGAGDDVIDVWMDLQYGKWPATKSIDSAVRIGDELTLVVGARDENGEADLQVKDCYAHSTPDVADPTGYRIQLTDFNGCVIKKKLMGPFASESGTGQYSGNIIKYAAVQAFSFPDSMDVYTSCNVEVCKGRCEPNPCQPSEYNPSGSTLLPEGATTPRPEAPVPPRTTTGPTRAPVTVQVTTRPYVPPITGYLPPEQEYLPPTTTRSPVPPTLPPVIQTPASVPPQDLPSPPPPTRPTIPPTFAPIRTVPPTLPPAPTIPVTFPSRPVPTTPPPPPPIDYLPPAPPPTDYLPPLDYLPPQPPASPGCVAGDPLCEPTVILPPTTPNSVIEYSTLPPPCVPGSNDPRCPRPPPPPGQPVVGPCGPSGVCSPPLVPEQKPTLPTLQCPPGSTAPWCPQPTQPDIVVTPPPVPSRPPCFPGSNNPACGPPPTAAPAATKPPTCFPGSPNPACAQPVKPIETYPPSIQPIPALCLPNSKNPECNPQPIPGSSNQFEVTEKVEEPFVQRTTQMPSKEWTGDSASHAFHMFHFQRGDGRRSRLLQRSKVKRSSDAATEEIAQVRLTRSIRILPLAKEASGKQDLPETEAFSGGSIPTDSFFCLKKLEFTSVLAIVCFLLIALATGIAVICKKYHSIKTQLSKYVEQP